MIIILKKLSAVEVSQTLEKLAGEKAPTTLGLEVFALMVGVVQNTLRNSVIPNNFMPRHFEKYAAYVPEDARQMPEDTINQYLAMLEQERLIIKAEGGFKATDELVAFVVESWETLGLSGSAKEAVLGANQHALVYNSGAYR